MEGRDTSISHKAGHGGFFLLIASIRTPKKPLTRLIIGGTVIFMKITFDPAKRAATLKHRGLDFVDVAEVFAGDFVVVPDDRRHYGELRLISAGFGGDGLDSARRRSAHHLDEALPWKRGKSLAQANGSIRMTRRRSPKKCSIKQIGTTATS
ncbi:MAG: BrnT family toxin [Roseiarcus sp.]